MRAIVLPNWSLRPASRPKKICFPVEELRLDPIHKMSTYTPDKIVEVKHRNAKPHMVAVDECTKRACHLSPRYQATEEIDKWNLRIWLAASHTELAQASSLIESVHPKGSSRRGTILCMSESNQQNSERLIGAAVLDTLSHCNPIERDVLARPKFGVDWRDASRSEIIYRLGLVCGTRFAICECRQRQGLGRVLAHHASVVAACWRWPPADVVEVLRWMPGDRLLKILRGEADFLTRAGYTPTPSSHWMKGGAYDPERLPDVVPVRQVPAWYYRRVKCFRDRDPVIAAALKAVL